MSIRLPNGVLTIVGDYKPGDLPPEGYLEWHEWAEVQRKAKIKQVQCCHCAKWKTPQELSGELRECRAFRITHEGRIPVITQEPVCTKCKQKEQPK